jgi:hypothetical protein
MRLSAFGESQHTVCVCEPARTASYSAWVLHCFLNGYTTAMSALRRSITSHCTCPRPLSLNGIVTRLQHSNRCAPLPTPLPNTIRSLLRSSLFRAQGSRTGSSTNGGVPHLNVAHFEVGLRRLQAQARVEVHEARVGLRDERVLAVLHERQVHQRVALLELRLGRAPHVHGGVVLVLEVHTRVRAHHTQRGACVGAGRVTENQGKSCVVTGRRRRGVGIGGALLQSLCRVQLRWSTPRPRCDTDFGGPPATEL